MVDTNSGTTSRKMTAGAWLLAFFGMVLGLGLVGFAVVYPRVSDAPKRVSASSAADPNANSSTDSSAASIRPGQCYTFASTGGSQFVACSQPHTGEIAAVVDAPGAFSSGSPTSQEIDDAAKQYCTVPATAYAGQLTSNLVVKGHVLVNSQNQVQPGRLACGIESADGSKITGSVKTGG